MGESAKEKSGAAQHTATKSRFWSRTRARDSRVTWPAPISEAVMSSGSVFLFVPVVVGAVKVVTEWLVVRHVHLSKLSD